MLGTRRESTGVIKSKSVQHIRDNQECFGVEFDEIKSDELGRDLKEKQGDAQQQ